MTRKTNSSVEVQVEPELSAKSTIFKSMKRAQDMYVSQVDKQVSIDKISHSFKYNTKQRDEYANLEESTSPLVATAHTVPSANSVSTSSASALYEQQSLQHFVPKGSTAVSALSSVRQVTRPTWHAPWKLMRVISGHTGWVRSVAVDVSNEWFATGSSDRTIKIWDLASGTLKLSLTGHIEAIRGLAVSDRHPYLFSVGDDKMVKCWDLEQNKVVRHYHGHLSGVHGVAVHPTLDVLVTCSRDATARVWDMRTKQAIHVLTGHQNTVASVVCQDAEPQVITSSMDSTVRLWDLKTGKSRVTLTNHKKSVRAVAIHPREYTFASGSPDNIKQWSCPDGAFIQNLSGHRAIINTLCVNADGVLFSGGDDGSMSFWDWTSGYRFQESATLPQPGSLESEAGIYASTFDKSGTRLITAEADKSIKIWKEDENATQETHPIQWQPSLKRERF